MPGPGPSNVITKKQAAGFPLLDLLRAFRLAASKDPASPAEVG